jgi:PAS domain S-box-containing protein
MSNQLFSLCTPCPEGFVFCRDFRLLDFRRGPFALYAPSVEVAREFLGQDLQRLAGVILIPGEHLSSTDIAPLVSQVTLSPSMIPYLGDFVAHQLTQLERRISNEERRAFLTLENARLELNNQRTAEEFSRFRDSLLHEIEERRTAERQLAESEEVLRLIMSSTVEGVYGVNTEGVCTFANESCLKMLGYEHIGEMLGRNAHDLIHFRTSDGQPMQVKECRIYKAFMEGTGVTVADEFFWRRDGSFIPVEYSSYPIRKDGVIVGAVVTWRDITDRKELEEERLNIEKQLLHAQKLESLGVLAGGIAHDFNNILTAIIGNADLALMRINKESPAVENLRRIEQAAARAADLAKQMLAYSGKGKFIVENIDLNVLLKDMLHMLELSISKKAVLRLNLHHSLLLVEADATQIRQIIMNLVINASEAIGDKSGVIAITTGCMECDRSYLKDVWLGENPADCLYVYLEIADTGCGMDPETLAKLFDPFFTTKFTGRGLGMAAVLGIVHGHKGAIKVYSEPGKGSTFKILLPASGRPAELCNDSGHSDEFRGSGTVLLVDDEETIRGVGSEMLKELGFSVLTADDGLEAVSVFKQHPEISFVILDLTMPHMDGEQCFRELRQLKPDVTVIISSGYNEQEVTQKFVGKGLAGFIQKPYKLSALKDAIRNLERAGQ